MPDDEAVATMAVEETKEHRVNGPRKHGGKRTWAFLPGLDEDGVCKALTSLSNKAARKAKIVPIIAAGQTSSFTLFFPAGK